MNFSDKAKQVLATIAPILGTAVLGPVGGMAGAAIAKALGVPEGDAAAAEKALLGATPDQLLALKKADQDFAVRIKELGISEEKLGYDDTASARAREMVVKDNTPAILAYGVTIGFFGVLGYILGYGVPKVGGDALLVLLGSLGTAWTGVVSYYFGSSASGKAKDQTIAAIAKS